MCVRCRTYLVTSTCTTRTVHVHIHVSATGGLDHNIMALPFQIHVHVSLLNCYSGITDTKICYTFIFRHQIYSRSTCMSEVDKLY